ncbi:MAG: hypothetical protein UT69_C0010G0009 [Candidatus Yanofskybacteria bacterium GW2011_GWE1_40_10]|nr:MAG: hypothetical protein UT69_C0010G0009 [Candidatus Yanofskybacteria bacterium GW2011_GWE1_40_10]
MPLTKKEDFDNGDENSNFCLYCVNTDGSVKSCEEIFEGGVQFFMTQIEGDRMGELSYWRDKNCEVLKGEMATDEEFAEVMKKLS